jgi:hypothetical protein
MQNPRPQQETLRVFRTRRVLSRKLSADTKQGFHSKLLLDEAPRLQTAVAAIAKIQLVRHEMPRKLYHSFAGL